jgi:uncharacterized protein (TIGR02246 family)
MRKSLLALLSVTILTHFAGPALCDATDRAKGGNAVMPGADDVVKSMMERYTRAVNANDSAAYSKLFAADAIRVPPGSDPEYGPAQIAKSEQSDYDQARWSIKMTLIDALGLNEQWVYGLVHVDASLSFYADGKKAAKHATKAFLLQRQPNGDWLIKRYIWNLKP